MSSPKPPFHQQINGRRHVQRNIPEITSHQEVTKYIYDAWKSVCKDIDITKQCAGEGKVCSVVYYKETHTDEAALHPDFKPFDLEAFLKQRSACLQNNKQPAAQ